MRGELAIEATPDVDMPQFFQLGPRALYRFAPLAGEIGVIRIGLRTDRYIFARGYQHGPADEPHDAVGE